MTSTTGFDNDPSEGLIGLGWPSLAVDHEIPIMQNLLPQLDQPIFTIWLDKSVNSCDLRMVPVLFQYLKNK
jgi:hypothetical protein